MHSQMLEFSPGSFHYYIYMHILKCNKQSDCVLFLQMYSFKKCKNKMHVIVTHYKIVLKLNSRKLHRFQTVNGNTLVDHSTVALN